MTRAVVFRTPGLIPIEAFTHLGVNAKPNSKSPIGYFGTGLKYAIAVLVREGLKPVVWIGRNRYEFYPKKRDFRGKEFTFIRMKRKYEGPVGEFLTKATFKYEDLPFTTEYGKNWDLWQAFRELETNTRDENGETSIMENIGNCSLHETFIVIEGEAFIQEYRERFKTFLDPALELMSSSDYLEVYAKPSKYLYYRGMRVYDFPDNKPSKFTYNVLERVELTEDRTIKWPHQIDQVVGKFTAEHTEAKFIRRVTEKDDKHWEGSINWEYIYYSPGEVFKAVLGSKYEGYIPSGGATSYYSGYAPRSRVSPLAGFPKPWEVDRRETQSEELCHNVVTDATGKVLFDSSNSERREVHFEADSSGDPDLDGTGNWTDIGTLGLFKYLVDKINNGED